MNNPVLPIISVSDASTSEREGARIDFSLSISGEVSSAITINYTLAGITATPDEDFASTAGSVTIEPGTGNSTIAISIVDDTIKELDEKFQITLSNSAQFTIDDNTAIGIIRDNDDLSSFDELGYFTPSSYFGYDLSWADEFDGTELSEEDYNYEVGDGCDLGICGWGNNELQKYTSDVQNSALIDGKLVITAIEESPNVYSSARITTKGKQKFRFGRIDIRAKLPYGQGIWPALWMLGSNIDDKGWPSCGEIDIMEMVGHVPDEVLGTAHWGTSPGPSIHTSGKKRNAQDYSEAFHVFTMEWTSTEMKWYVDEEIFHTITAGQLNGAANPFINDFFFIFNVAVGGNLPGNPDDTTTFPQSMEVDYIRVFQLK
ncbi:UNVERIFIED_CONTAM: hypothetical protein GTU68_058244 [Idotea baltica]|nr:hypothetical protein [Idotea baltica]